MCDKKKQEISAAIEAKRAELHKLIDAAIDNGQSLTDGRILEVSMELDALINKYNEN